MFSMTLWCDHKRHNTGNQCILHTIYVAVQKQYAEVHSQTIGLTSSPTQNKVFVEQDVEALSSTSCENK